MKPSRRRVTLLVLVIGLASLLIPIDLRDAVERPGIGALEVAVFELSPFLVLALAARWLAWWLTIGCALVLGAFLLETAREVAESRSSTAGLAYRLRRGDPRLGGAFGAVTRRTKRGLTPIGA